MISIKAFTFNPFQENTYVLYDGTQEAIIVDPGCSNSNEQQQLVNFIEQHHLKPVKLVNTHCHIDHILGNAFVARKWKLELEANFLDIYNIERAVEYGLMFGIAVEEPPIPAVDLVEGNQLRFGNSSLEILFTPGHSLGSVSFYSSLGGFVIGGDVLFMNSIGRTDLPGGDFDVLENSIKTKMYTLPATTKVYSGHGLVTTIGHEMANNPFVKG